VRSGLPRALGYFLPESSVIVPIDECPVLSPRLAHTFAKLQDMTRAGTLPAGIQEIEAFADSADEKIALNMAFEKFPKPAEELAATFRGALPEIESLLLLDQKKNRFELTGSGYLTHEAGGFQYRVSHLSFFQVNRFLIEDLLKTVTANAQGALALDLYAGVGFFTLPLAHTFQKVVSVDANLAATRDLHSNAQLAGVTIASHNEHVEEFLKKTSEKPEFVVLDPPRAGLGAEAAAKLAELGAQEIVYLSCDPSTLARDLAVLTNSARKPKEIAGPSVRYEITEMHLFDLFPQTFHIETLVRLRKAP
jgi:23S rRNA (uracil1939-C5)-methyltransferase